MKENIAGLFLHDTLENMQFSINFFTAIGLWSLTENLREEFNNKMN